MARRESSFRLRPKRTFSLSLTFNRSLLSRESRTVRITRFDESRQSNMRAAPSAAEVRQFRRGRSKAPKAKAHRRASPPRGSSSSCRTAHLRCSPRARATRARLEHARSALMDYCDSDGGCYTGVVAGFDPSSIERIDGRNLYNVVVYSTTFHFRPRACMSARRTG